MSVSVTMPQLGESVTEGTVTRWLKREGERVEADEPLLEVSTDKVDTEIPSPVGGTVRGITVAEDETVAVGAELAVIDEDGAAAGNGGAVAQDRPVYQTPYPEPAPEPTPQPAGEPAGYEPGGYWPPEQQQAPAAYVPPPAPEPVVPHEPAAPEVQPAEPAATVPPPAQPQAQPAPPAEAAAPPPPAPEPAAPVQPAPVQETHVPQYAPEPAFQATAPSPGIEAPAANGVQPAPAADGPYVTPLVRKLAAEHGIDLATVPGTGVGGRIRKQDVLEAARLQRGAAPDAPQAAQPAAAAPAATQQVAAAAPVQAQPTAAPAAAPAATAPPEAAPKALAREAATPSVLRGRTEKLSRSRQIIAQRMMESLQTSAQLTTVVEADITAIARLRDRSKDAFEAREGVRLSFLPFFALATVEALKVHPALNAIIDSAASEVTYHDDEHLGIAVDTPRGLMVPVIRKAGDLNLAGLARKIADLAERTRAGRVSPDELSGGTFTLTNTGSRGALFDTPIINQPQVGILGTGSVVRRAVVVEDPTLGEVVAVRSMVYLSLTYDHRLVDGADAARFLVTLKSRLEEGAFESEVGL